MRWSRAISGLVMPGLDPGIHASLSKDVDGRDEPVMTIRIVSDVILHHHTPKIFW